MSSEQSGAEAHWERMLSRKPPTGAELAEALGLAREELVLQRWWWKGQPAVDRIRATVEVPVAQAGQLIAGLHGVTQGRGSIIFDGFPLGVPAIDRVLVNLQVDALDQ